MNVSELNMEELSKQIEERFGPDFPANPTGDVHDALVIAERLQKQGYEFAMKDMCPRSMTDSMWRAVFAKDGAECAAENPQAAVAVCLAALGAVSA